MSATTSTLRRAVSAAWRRRWTFGVPIATLLLPAAVYAVRQPDVFKASALVALSSVRPESIGAGGVLPQKAETRLEHVVATARNRLLTHQNLATVVPALYPQKPAGDSLSILAAKGRFEFDQVGEGAFTISLEDRDPATAARGVNALLDAFLHGERATLHTRAQKNAEFMQRKAVEADAEFERARQRLEEFRRAHEDGMPDQKDAILERLRRLDAAARDKETLAATSARLAQEYERLLRQSPRDDKSQRVATAEEVQLDLQLRGAQTALDRATQELSTAQTKYTAKHPAIAQLLGEVESLEKQVASAREELQAARARADDQAVERRTVETRDWLTTLDRMRIGAVEEQRVAVVAAQGFREEMEDLQAKLAAIPAVEASLRPIRTAYEAAAKEREDRERDARNAKAAVDFYATTDAAEVTGFDVKERAVVPFQPSGPQRWRFLAVAAGVGGLLGYLLLAIQRRAREETIVTPLDLSAFLPSAFVVSVPLLGGGAVARRHRTLEWALSAYVILFLGASAYAIVAHRGAVAVPGWLRPVLGIGA